MRFCQIHGKIYFAQENCELVRRSNPSSTKGLYFKDYVRKGFGRR
jgi:hypothetical protein